MQKAPNIILINADDLGYGDLGCYGSTLNRTPALDQLAAEGMRFTDFYMASSVCSPSRGAMLTGCYPRRIGFGSFEGRWVLFPGQGVGLAPTERTMADVLRGAGYATAHIGKWHCGDQPPFLPTRHGFDTYYGLPYSNDMGRQIGRDDRYPPLPLLRNEEVIQEQPDQAGLTERYTEEAVRFIRSNHQRPFFLYLAHLYVHRPLIVPRRFEKASQNGAYGAAVECMDWSVAVLMHEIRRLGLEESTLFLFTSDNGSRGRDGGSNAPLRGGKGTTWEGGFRVPLIARWKGHIPAGAVCREVVTAMDFLPTFARLAGTEPPTDRHIDGHDIRPILFGVRGATSPTNAFFYYMSDRLEAVRSGPWKLFVSRFDRKAGISNPVRELYQLNEDIGETTNVADQHPDVVEMLLRRVDVCRRDIGDEVTGIPGFNCRPIGRVFDPQPLTRFDPSHPYIEAMYDTPDAG